MRPFPVVVLLVAVLAAACGDDSSEPPADESITGTWVVDTIAGDAVLDGSTVTLTVDDDGSASANTGCNRVNTQVEIDGDSVTVATPMAMTLMACPAESLADQERAYVAALESAVTFEVSSDSLTLFDDAGGEVLTATRVPSTLAGTSWTVTRVNNGRGGIQTLINGTELTADFGTDGTISGSSGCNTYRGAFEIDGDAIAVRDVAATEMFCAEPDGIMEQEQLFLAALEVVTTVQMDGLNVWLRDDDGAAWIVLAAA